MENEPSPHDWEARSMMFLGWMLQKPPEVTEDFENAFAQALVMEDQQDAQKVGRGK